MQQNCWRCRLQETRTNTVLNPSVESSILQLIKPVVDFRSWDCYVFNNTSIAYPTLSSVRSYITLIKSCFTLYYKIQMFGELIHRLEKTYQRALYKWQVAIALAFYKLTAIQYFQLLGEVISKPFPVQRQVLVSNRSNWNNAGFFSLPLITPSLIGKHSTSRTIFLNKQFYSQI